MRSTWMPSRTLVMFAGRTALAAVLALVCSIALGLHEPHWAAWTVVSVGLPSRGDGLQKSLNRAIGTIIGAAVGVLLVFAAHGDQPLLVGLLSAWLAVGVYAGITLRNYRAYAAVLAGYTAVILAMSLAGESGHLLDVGRDRCTGILIGIACALVVVLSSRDVQSGQANQRIRRAIAAACQWSADRLAGLPRAVAGDGIGPQRLRGQLSEILALDGAVHSATAESPALWTLAGRLHGVVTALLDLLVISRSVERNTRTAARHGAMNEEVEAAVAKASVLLASVARTMRGEPTDEVEELRVLRWRGHALRKLLSSIHAGNVIERRRIDLVSALLGASAAILAAYAVMTREPHVARTETYPAPVYALNRHYAITAALRAASALLLAGFLWIATGWQGGPLFVSFTGIAIALFAIRPDPRHTGIHFLASGAVGAGAALLFYLMVAPHIPHAVGIALAEGCAVFIAIVLASLLSNTFWASGFCLVFLVVSDPDAISHTTVAAVNAHALGVLAGTALAALAFHLVPSRKLERQWRERRLKQIADAVRTLVASPVARHATEKHHAWQSASIDTLVRFGMPAASEREVEACMTWIEIGVEFLRLRELARVELLPLSAKKTIDDLLADLKGFGPQSWQSRLVATQSLLQDAGFAGDQRVMRAGAIVAELSELLQRASMEKQDVDSPERCSERESVICNEKTRQPTAY
jgi:uncharacterized membrane protein YccC